MVEHVALRRMGDDQRWIIAADQFHNFLERGPVVGHEQITFAQTIVGCADYFGRRGAFPDPDSRDGLRPEFCGAAVTGGQGGQMDFVPALVQPRERPGAMEFDIIRMRHEGENVSIIFHGRPTL